MNCHTNESARKGECQRLAAPDAETSRARVLRATFFAFSYSGVESLEDVTRMTASCTNVMAATAASANMSAWLMKPSGASHGTSLACANMPSR